MARSRRPVATAAKRSNLDLRIYWAVQALYQLSTRLKCQAAGSGGTVLQCLCECGCTCVLNEESSRLTAINLLSHFEWPSHMEGTVRALAVALQNEEPSFPPGLLRTLWGQIPKAAAGTKRPLPQDAAGTKRPRPKAAAGTKRPLPQDAAGTKRHRPKAAAGTKRL